MPGRSEIVKVKKKNIGKGRLNKERCVKLTSVGSAVRFVFHKSWKKEKFYNPQIAKAMP